MASKKAEVHCIVVPPTGDVDGDIQRQTTSIKNMLKIPDMEFKIKKTSMEDGNTIVFISRVFPPAKQTQQGAAVSEGGAFPKRLNPEEYIKKTLEKWELEWDPDLTDGSQYVVDNDGSSRFVGKSWGVTPALLAAFNDVDASWITSKNMRDILSTAPDRAAEIHHWSIFRKGGFDRLIWSPLTAVTVDAALMSGTGRAVKMLQEMIGTSTDGSIGQQTVESLATYLETHDIKKSCQEMSERRSRYYADISEDGTKNARFRGKWLERANWAKPEPVGIKGMLAAAAIPKPDNVSDGTEEGDKTNTSSETWWDNWRDWKLPHPSGSSSAIGLEIQAPPKVKPPAPMGLMGAISGAVAKT